MIKIILFSVATALLIFILNFFSPNAVHPAVWQILFFLAALTLIGHNIVETISQKSKQSFVYVYFGIMVVRLLMSFAFVAFFAFRGVSNLMLFSLNFFILYLLFMSFEIYLLLSNLRRNLKS